MVSSLSPGHLMMMRMLIELCPSLRVAQTNSAIISSSTLCDISVFIVLISCLCCITM